MYIKLTSSTAENYSLEQLRHDNPQTSFPKNIPDTLLAEYEVFPLTILPSPEIDKNTQFLRLSEFYQVDGKWQQHYVPENLPEAQVSDSMRFLRNQKLTESDWTQVADAPVDKVLWAEYRQTLRDITSQPDFPTTVNWPVKPE